MLSTRNRFSLVLQLSAEAMSPSSSPRGGLNRGSPSSPSLSVTPASPASSTFSIVSTGSPAKKDISPISSPSSPRPRFNGNTEDSNEERSSLLHKVSRVFSKLPKVDVTPPTTATSDRGIDYARFHQSGLADGQSGKSPSTSSVLLPSPCEGAMLARPMTAPSRENKRLGHYRRSLSQSALVESIKGDKCYSKIDDESSLGPTSRRAEKQKSLRDSSKPGQRLKRTKRRKSFLDLAHFTRSSIPSTAIPVENIPPLPDTDVAASLKRSASLWNRPGHASSDSVNSTNAAFQSRYRQNFGQGSPLREKVMSRRQKSLNVKRAKKMAQVFGDEPPQELFEIVVEDEDEDDVTMYRDSMASSFSLSSAFLLSKTPEAPAVDEPVSNDKPSELRESIQPARRPRLETDLAVEAHPTAAPFSSIHGRELGNLELDLATDDLSDPCHFDTEFHDRRKRAAKLSKFFGVGYHEFTDSLPPPQPLQSVTAHVDVRATKKSWFWENHRAKPKPVHMSDAIGKLRELR